MTGDLRGSPIAVIAQDFGERGVLIGKHVAGVRSHTVDEWVLRGEKRRMRGQGARSGAHALQELGSLRGKPIEVGCDGPSLTIAAERIRAGRIQRNQHDVQRAVSGWLRRDGGHFGRLRFSLASRERQRDEREAPKRSSENRLQSICTHCPYPIDSRCACTIDSHCACTIDSRCACKGIGNFRDSHSAGSLPPPTP